MVLYTTFIVGAIQEMAEPMTLTRRKLIGGIGLLVAAPAIVRASSLMPVKSLAHLEGANVTMLSGYEPVTWHAWRPALPTPQWRSMATGLIDPRPPSVWRIPVPDSFMPELPKRERIERFMRLNNPTAAGESAA